MAGNEAADPDCAEDSAPSAEAADEAPVGDPVAAE